MCAFINSIFDYYFLNIFCQAIDIFVSKNSDLVDYRLNAADWAQIESYIKILEVCLLSGYL